MRRILPPIGLAIALQWGCARRQAVDPTPAWDDPNVQIDTKLELAEVLMAESPDAALSLIGQMRQQGVTDVRLDVLQARALQSEGLLDDAADLLWRASRKRPRDPAVRNAYGLLLMDLNQPEEALKQFTAAVRLDPRQPKSQNNLGFALMAMGEHDAASEALREALRLDGSSLRTRNNLGFALVAQGRDKEAWRVFQAGTQPADAHYNLALGLELRGDPTAALEHYETALGLAPEHPEAQQAVARLRAPSPETP